MYARKIHQQYIAFITLLIILTVTLFGCRFEKEGEDLSSSQSEASQDTYSPRPESDYQPEIPEVSSQLKEAQSQNSDVVGWIKIPGTTVDEAVVQSSDNDYYYRRDVLKNYAFEGSIWMDYENTIGKGTAEEIDQNIILYGHNLGNPQGIKDDPEGVKFAQLLKFTQEDFARRTPYFFFITESGKYIYEVFAAFYTEAQMEPVRYHYPTFSDEQFSKLLSDARNRSLYHYNVPMEKVEKIMTLSTCSYKYGTYRQNPNQRFVVMARLVSEDESLYEEADITKNPFPKEPVFS